MKTLRLPALGLCVLFALPQPAHAQLGGLIKKKVTEAVKGPEKDKEPAKAQDGANPKAPEFTERVVELTEPVVKGVMKGIDLQVAQLTKFENYLVKYKTEEEYDACQEGIARSPEGQKIGMQVASVPPNSSAEEMQKVIEKMNLDMNALVDKKCGASILTEWPDYNRQQRIDVIHLNAAEAAGLLLTYDEQGRVVKRRDEAAPADFVHEPVPTTFRDESGDEVAVVTQRAAIAEFEQQGSAVNQGSTQKPQTTERIGRGL